MKTRNEQYQLKDVMNCAEAAQYLRISKTTLLHLVARGEIPFTKINIIAGKRGRFIFTRNGLLEWAISKQQRTAVVNGNGDKSQ